MLSCEFLVASEIGFVSSLAALLCVFVILFIFYFIYLHTNPRAQRAADRVGDINRKNIQQNAG